MSFVAVVVNATFSLILGLVRVLLVSVSVVARPTSVSVAAGKVTTYVEAIAAALRVVAPDVAPPNNNLASLKVFAPETVSALPSVMIVPEAAGPVTVVPSIRVNVADVAGAVMATLLIEVADATPKVGVVRLGLASNTMLPLVVPVVPVALVR